MDIFEKNSTISISVLSNVCRLVLFQSIYVYCIYYNNTYTTRYIAFNFCWFWWNETASKPKWAQKMKWNKMNSQFCDKFDAYLADYVGYAAQPNQWPLIDRRYFPSHDIFSDNVISCQQNDNPSTLYIFSLDDIQYLTKCCCRCCFSFVRPIHFPYCLCVCVCVPVRA